MPPTKPTVDDRRRAMLEVAGRVFSEKGFQRATTLDIATAAGVSKRDLYALFPSKAALLEALIRGSVDALATPVSLPPARSRGEIFATLTAFGKAFLEMLLAPHVVSLYRLAIAEAPASADVGRALLESGAQRSIALVADYLAKAEAAGLIRFAHFDAAVGAYFFGLMGDLLMRALLAPGQPITQDERARHAGLAVLLLQRMELPENPR